MRSAPVLTALLLSLSACGDDDIAFEFPDAAPEFDAPRLAAISPAWGSALTEVTPGTTSVRNRPARRLCMCM